ncbi:MAG: hypothetical protein J6D18_01030 [Erysipelotrichaceae bacterium]|nr:hypothetical protein [Erysipelotrichaceae bacterium]
MEKKPSTNSRMKKLRPKQGHKLVWFTLILIAIPVIFVAYVLLTSSIGQNRPVVGNRFHGENLDPKITEEDLTKVQESVAKIGGVDNAVVTLKSATLRVNLDVTDSADQEAVQNITEAAYEEVNKKLPIDRYFTNREKAKMYDLEISGYNYIVDDSHPADGQIYVKITKTGPGYKVVDVLSAPKDPELVEQITR